MKKISDKKLATLGRVPFSSITSPRTPIAKGGKPKVNHKRRRKTHEKAHGPKARGRWIATLPCAACGVVGYSQPAHVLGNSGMGKKKGPETIAPLCGPRLLLKRWATMYDGCHRLFDERRWDFDEMYPEFNPEAEAAKQDAAWLASRPPLEASPK